MSNLQIFNYQNNNIRTVLKYGEPWFVAKDVCSVLEISDTWNAVSRLNDLMKDTDTISTLGGNQQMQVISEAGVYKLVFTSRKPEAEKFTDWLASEVIPSIRKHGTYMTPEFVYNAMTNPDNLILFIQQYKEEQQMRISAEEKIKADRPKVLFADSVAISNGTILIGELAKIIKQNGVDIGEKRLFNWLRKNGYLISRKGTDYNSPTQKSMNLGLFTIKETSIQHSDGNVTITKTSKVTGKGQQYFVNKFLCENQKGA